MTNTAIVEVRGGIATVTSGEAIVIDWDNGMDYDTACIVIDEIFHSDLDGPAQMRFIADIAKVFLDGC
jgi:hypothetical protein